MNGCNLCRDYRFERGETFDIYNCHNEDVSEEQFGAILDGDVTCPHWYPGKEQRTYTLLNGRWAHQCERQPNYAHVTWFSKRRVWEVWDELDDSSIVANFCPYCGWELAPMPEEKEC